MLGPLGQPLLATKDLESLRVAFEPLSDTLADQVRASGDQAGGVYLVHCPMAFDNQGASWLSPDPEVLNPYFADRMLRCRSVRETLSLGDNTPPDPADHTHAP